MSTVATGKAYMMLSRLKEKKHLDMAQSYTLLVIKRIKDENPYGARMLHDKLMDTLMKF